MKENFQAALEHVLRSEGGFVNHPLDPGGMTNLGVTKKVWEEWLDHSVDEQAMRALTPADVTPLYKHIWDRIKGDALPDGVDYVVFDAAVNSGPGRAAKWLQGAVGAWVDGSIGPNTLKAVAAFSADDLIHAYQAKRLEFLQNLPTWGTFGKGWARRVADVTSTAQTFA
jgi:lysozyme family protein